MFFNLKRKDLYVFISILRLITMNFNDAFMARTRDNSGTARKYIQGLLLIKIEAIAAGLRKRFERAQINLCSISSLTRLGTKEL